MGIAFDNKLVPQQFKTFILLTIIFQLSIHLTKTMVVLFTFIA